MTHDIRGPVVVTGGGGALGRAVVSEFLAAGEVVVAVDRSSAALDALPPEVHREQADLGDPEQVDGLVARIQTAHGTPSVLVHTVGMFRDGAAAETTADDYRLVMDVNLHAAWWISRAVGAAMRDAGRGAIVHIGARQGLQPSAGAAAYSLTKAAVIHLTRVLDAELRAAGIRVNAVVPGLIDTLANRSVMPEAAMAGAVKPEAIAKVIGFLAGPHGGPVAGGVIPVDNPG